MPNAVELYKEQQANKQSDLILVTIPTVVTVPMPFLQSKSWENMLDLISS
jgi:hypothetical protein